MRFRIFLFCYLSAVIFATQNVVYYSLDDFDFSMLGLDIISAGSHGTQKPSQASIDAAVMSKITTNVTNCYEVLRSESLKPWQEYRVVKHKSDNLFYAKRTNPIAKFLNVSLIYENENTLELIIKDHNRSSFEIPLKEPFPHRSLLNFDSQNFSKSVLNYHVEVETDPFSVKIMRKETNEVIFDMKEENLLLSKQYLEFGSSTPTKDIFGMGERNFQFRLIPGIYTVWARDEVGDIETGQQPGHSSYGVHPMHLTKEKSGNYFVSFLRSSNPFDFIINENSTINYKIAGGIIHLKFFLGDMYPETAIKRYHEYIEGFGMPPFWSFGFHQSRWGFNNVAALRESLEGHKRHDIPVEVIWLDIDYMYDHIPFITDVVRFNPIKLKALKAEFNVKMVPIIDPAIPYKTSAASKELLDQGCYVRDTSGNPFIGRLHSGESIFPDFFHPRAKIFWNKMFMMLHEDVPFDGIWLDMNEPTSFCDGACFKYPFGLPKTQYDLEALAAAEDIRMLPYVPGNRSLEVKTLSLNSIHHPNRVHVDVHSLYSIQETYETFKILKEKFEMELPFILVRSSFAGNGKYSAHWTGDNLANWDFLRISIPSLMNLNMFGIPMSGDDICGFFGNTTEPLCARWIQLSSLYPFSRNHNHKEFTDHQFHNMGPNIISLASKAYKFRYSMLKYYYSLFLEKRGRGMVIQPLFFRYISDPMLMDDTIMNSQFLIGTDMMITPVLERFKEHITPYFPKDIWYDLHTGRRVIDLSESNRYLMIYNSMSELVPIFVRGGSIIPLQNTVNVSNTNDLSKDYYLHIFLKDDKAQGQLIDIDNLADEKMIIKTCIEDPNGCLFGVHAEINTEEEDYFSVRVSFTKNNTIETLSKTNSISRLVINAINLKDVSIPVFNNLASLAVRNGSIVEKESQATFLMKSHPKDQGQLVFEFEPVVISCGGSFEIKIGLSSENHNISGWSDKFPIYYLGLLVVVYIFYAIYRVMFH